MKPTSLRDAHRNHFLGHDARLPRCFAAAVGVDGKCVLLLPGDAAVLGCVFSTVSLKWGNTKFCTRCTQSWPLQCYMYSTFAVQSFHTTSFTSFFHSILILISSFYANKMQSFLLVLNKRTYHVEFVVDVCQTVLNNQILHLHSTIRGRFSGHDIRNLRHAFHSTSNHHVLGDII